MLLFLTLPLVTILLAKNTFHAESATKVQNDNTTLSENLEDQVLSSNEKYQSSAEGFANNEMKKANERRRNKNLVWLLLIKSNESIWIFLEGASAKQPLAALSRVLVESESKNSVLFDGRRGWAGRF